MSTVSINKEIYQFLNSAIDPKNTLRPQLHYFLCTDVQRIVTTDGYRMHIWPTEEQYEPGYYQWDSYRLTRVNDEYVESKDFYLAKNLSYPNILSKAQLEPALMIYGCRRDNLTYINVKEYPKVNKTGYDMAFRKGIVDKEERCVCLGINAIPLEWGVDGLVSPVNLDKTIVLDAKYVLDALSSPVVRPCMRYVASDKPAIIGDMNGAHAVIMPLGNRR